MKKFLALIIALVMALSLVACGEQKQPDTPDVPDDGAAGCYHQGGLHHPAR